MTTRNTFLMSALLALMMPAAQGSILLVADSDAHAVWQVNEAGVTSLFVDLGVGNNPAGVAARGGSVFVLDSGHEEIRRYSTDGVLQGSFTSIGVSAIAVDLLGNVYAASLSLGTVTKYNSTGTQLVAPVTVDAPTALAVNSAGDVFIAETTGVGLGIRQYTAGLALIGAWAVPTNDPFGLAFSGDDDLYGAIGFENTVERYGPGPTTVFIGSNLSLPVALVFADNGDLFAANAGSNDVQQFTSAGVHVGSFGSGFSSVSGLAFASVPEPGTYAMIGIGLIALSFFRRGRWSATAQAVRRK